MEIDYKGIGARIHTYRKSLGITQAKLGESAGVEPSNISHIERGATKLSLPTLMKIANSLGVSLDDLVAESLQKSRHVSIKELDELLSDCSEREIKSIVQIVKSTKEILRK